MSKSNQPLVGIPCDVTRFGLNPFHGVGEKYINAVAHGADVCPMLIPAYDTGEDMQAMDQNIVLDRILNQIDGLFLSGSPSNIEPKNYSSEQSLTPEFHDPQRDSMNLSLIREAIKRKIPILAVCRGMQELNVALGGTLHQRVYEVEGLMDHREDKNASRQQQYSNAHTVELAENGLLAQLTGQSTLEVNSLHGQGMRTLGKGLIAEAHAPDGLIEAIRLDDHEHFVLAVQWHPEWQFQENPNSTAIFEAFGKAIRGI